MKTSATRTWRRWMASISGAGLLTVVLSAGAPFAATVIQIRDDGTMVRVLTMTPTGQLTYEPSPLDPFVSNIIIKIPEQEVCTANTKDKDRCYEQFCQAQRAGHYQADPQLGAVCVSDK
jgi:hypothetical protein